MNDHIDRIHVGILNGRVKKRLTRNSKKSSPSFDVSSTSFDVECIPVRDESLGKCSNLKVYLPNWVGPDSSVVFSELSKMLRDRRNEDTLPDGPEGLRYCIKLCVDNLKNHINCG